MTLREAAAVTVLVLFATACDDKKASTADAGATVKTTVASARTTRLDCGGSFGSCPAGESCHYDTPGCEATGFCGPAEPPCAHSISFCGCSGIELACTFPKRSWKDKGTQCFNSEPVVSASASAPPAASSAPRDAGRKAP